MTPKPTSPVTSTRVGEEMIQANNALAEKFSDHFHRYRPQIFGEDDRIAGPPITRTECMNIAAALRSQPDPSLLGRETVREVDPELAKTLTDSAAYVQSIRAAVIEECAKIARSVALQMLAGMKLPVDVRASDSQLSFGHKIADYIEADIRALASLSPLKE